MSFSQFRDTLLELAPLDVAHIQRVNRAEELFWRRSECLGHVQSSSRRRALPAEAGRREGGSTATADRGRSQLAREAPPPPPPLRHC